MLPRRISRILKESRIFLITSDSALHRTVLNYKLEPRVKNRDLSDKIIEFKVVAIDILQKHLIEGSFKFNIFLIATFQKALEPDIHIQAHFNKGRGA